MDSSQKLTNTDVKKLNKNRIFRLIYNSDKISRQEIADQLGLSLPTVNQNLKMLMEDGLIEYVGNFTSTGGRRAQAITINNNARKAISVTLVSCTALICWKSWDNFLLISLSTKTVLPYKRNICVLRSCAWRRICRIIRMPTLPCD